MTGVCVMTWLFEQWSDWCLCDDLVIWAVKWLVSVWWPGYLSSEVTGVCVMTWLFEQWSDWCLCDASVPPRFLDKDGNIMPEGNTIPENPQVVRDGTVKLLCPADAIPPPQITWYKNGKELTHDMFGERIVVLDGGRELIIYSADIKDTARYTCIASNLAGETEKNFDLDVQGERTWMGMLLLMLVGVSHWCFCVG